MNEVDDNLLADVASILETEVTTARIKPSVKIISVRDLISDQTLTIPEYQRPYKWTLKNVNDLLDDILLFKDKPAL